MRPALRTWPRRMAVVLGLLLLSLAGLAAASPTVASAASDAVLAAPWWPDCGTPPDPAVPGYGVAGQLDPPAPGQGVSGSPYSEVGYAGMYWTTTPDCGLGAVIDTTLGNWALTFAKFLVALTVAVNQEVASGGSLSALDGLVAALAGAMYQGVYSYLIGLALMVAGLVTAYHGMRGDLSSAGSKAGASLIGMALAGSVYLAPMVYTQMIGSLSGLLSGLRTSVLNTADVDGVGDLGTTLNRHVVYNTWLAGSFGDAESQKAQSLGRELLRAQAFTIEQVRSGAIGEDAAEAKKDQWKGVAEQMRPEAYPYLVGKAPALKSWTGFMGAIKAVIFCAYQLVAPAVVFVCLVLLRIMVFLAPVLGLLAVIRTATLLDLVNALGTAIWHAGFLMVAAAAGLVSMVYIVNLDIPFVGELLLMSVLLVALWLVTKPVSRLMSMFAATTALAGSESIAKPGGSGFDIKDVMPDRSSRGSGSGGGSTESQPPTERPDGDESPQSAPKLPSGGGVKTRTDGDETTSSGYGSAVSGDSPMQPAGADSPELVGAGSSSASGAASGGAGAAVVALDAYRRSRSDGSSGGSGGSSNDSEPVYVPSGAGARGQPESGPDREVYRPPRADGGN